MNNKRKETSGLGKEMGCDVERKRMEGTGRDGKGREGKGKRRDRKRKERIGKERKGEERGTKG